MKALAQVICAVELPINFGENPTFPAYVQHFVPNYKFVSRNTTRMNINQYFNKKKTALQEELSRDTFSVALTSDYVSVVAHYIYCNWQLQKRIKNFQLIDVSHSGQNIAEQY